MVLSMPPLLGNPDLKESLCWISLTVRERELLDILINPYLYQQGTNLSPDGNC